MNEAVLEKRLAQAEADIETLKAQYALCLKSLEASTTLVDTLLARLNAQSALPSDPQLEQRRQQMEAQIEQRRQQMEAQLQQQRQQAEAQIQQQRQQAEAQIQQQRQQAEAQLERQRQEVESLAQRARA
jgi:O-antigen chain-terminating methyltransferase